MRSNYYSRIYIVKIVKIKRKFMYEKPITCIFFGYSGSGKDTQEEQFVEHVRSKEERKVLSCVVGDKLREVKNNDTYTGKLTENVIDNGGLMPEFMPIWAWSNFLMDNFTGEEHLIFNGISRQASEAGTLHGALEFYNCDPVFVVFLNVSKEWAKERLLERGRSDDTEENIKNRFEWFDENTRKAVEYFKNTDYHFLDINGEQSISEVHQEILDKIHSNLNE